jgi:RecA-family ATPase
MTAYEVLESCVIAEMRKGNLHDARIRLGRLAGGYLASGCITHAEADAIERLCLSKSKTSTRCNREWREAVEYGKKEPLNFVESSEYFMAAKNEKLDWNDAIGGGAKVKPAPHTDNYKIVDTNWIQDEEIKSPGADWNKGKDVETYLSTLFEPDEFVGYVTESFIPKGETSLLPCKGACTRTAGKLIEELVFYKGDVGSVLGDYNPKAGAWIRFNPFDGKGIKDKNVTSHRYALVESDNISVSKQYAIIKKLELPCAILVHSGNKSLHAIVRIEAKDYDEYVERVNFLYEVCETNGLEVDVKNRNPSRLSRLPGIVRNDKQQFIIDSNIGQKSWNSWKTHIEDLNDELPDIECSDPFDPNKEPELSKPLIHGLLRQGHKLLISGPSKAGKSFALLQLCIACANGGKWFSWEVEQGKVLYINLELDPKSCRHRIWKICQTHKAAHANENLDIWNLRGHAVPLDKLVPKLIRRALKKRYSMIVIDPMYKVLTGDENSAADITKSFNEIDKLCTALKASLVVCHHHSKGEQWQKQSRDRSSGSGVFARDPDAVLDLIELEIASELRNRISNAWECEEIKKAFYDHDIGWDESVPEESRNNADKLAHWAESTGSGDAMRSSRGPAIESAQMATGWRVENTLREFPFCAHKNHFYRYPVHVEDTTGLLDDAKAFGEKGASVKVNAPASTEPSTEETTVKVVEEVKLTSMDKKQRQFMLDFEILDFANPGKVKFGELKERTGLSRDVMRNRIDSIKFLSRDKNGGVTRTGI